MFGHTYYHGSIRKYVALFGTLFNDIYIVRPNPDRNINQSIKVPITYGPREKVLARLTEDPSLNRMSALTLPRMSFELTDMQYASSRKLNTVNKRYARYDNDTSKMLYAYNPVPYDLNFTLSIIVKNADDGARIVEQIVPFFTPEWTTTVQLIPDLDETIDIPLILNDVRNEDQYENDFVQRRTLIWTLTFTMKGYFFGPVRRGGVIKFANTNIYTTMSSNTSSPTNITIIPGLTANGEPTSNVAESVDATYIYPDDNYGYIITIVDNDQ